jgi:hypothetical protein
MTDRLEDKVADYPVLVDMKHGRFCLRIKELGLVVRGSDIDLLYEELKSRRLELVEWAKAVNALDELPAAVPIPMSPVRWKKAR